MNNQPKPTETNHDNLNCRIPFCKDCRNNIKAVANIGNNLLNNQPPDRQSDETRSMRDSLDELEVDFLHGVPVRLPEKTKRQILAWHETEKQKAVELVDRFEVIDHRECVYCRGCATANYLQKDGSYKEQLCDKCDGSGIRGGRVYGAFSNPETSIIKVELSYQDDGKTLKVFVSDRELNKSKGGKI